VHQEELRHWLRIALMAANLEGMAELDTPARDKWAKGLVAGLMQRPEPWWRPPGVAPGNR
jgi:hypothetical protein